MALSQLVAWETDPITGDDANGGGFKLGASGTNFAYPTSSPVTPTGLTASGAGSVVLCATAAATWVGNIALISNFGGSGFIFGRYEVVSVVPGVSFSTDRNCTSGVATGGFANVGGALASMGTMLVEMNTAQSTSMQGWVKNNADQLFNPGIGGLLGVGSTGSTANYATHIYGYGTTHGDNQRVNLVAQGSSFELLSQTGNWCQTTYHNFVFNGGYSTYTGVTGVNNSSNRGSQWHNCIFTHCGLYALLANDGSPTLVDCEVTDCGISAGSAVVQCNASSSAVFIRVWVHKNKNGALTTDSHTTVVDSVIVNGLTGGANVGKGPAFISGGDAFQIVVTGNLIYGHNSDGLFFSDIRSFGKAIVQSNIIAKNGGWGINVAVAGTSNFPNFVSRNFFYGNTSGVISNSYAIDSTNITVSVNPFNGNETNLLADTDYDFSLNSATTGGALIRNAGAPGSIASMPTAVGYRDGGPLNHQEALRGTMI